MPTRDRADFVAHATWRSHGLYIWGWNGVSSASVAWFYANSTSRRGGADQPWVTSPLTLGELSRVTLELPSGARHPVAAARLDPFTAAVWLAEGRSPRSSPSVAWFGRLAEFAVRLVDAGRLSPTITLEGAARCVRWKPVLDDAQRHSVSHLASCAPAIAHGGSQESTAAILASMVDGIARSSLDHDGWRPALDRKRSLDRRVARAVFSAASTPDPILRSGPDDLESGLLAAAADLDRHAGRLAGEPAIRGRVRLRVPDDLGDPWAVELELVDDDDPGRWCTADDVWLQATRASDLAPLGGRRHLLADALRQVAAQVAERVPSLADWAATDQPSIIELDIEAVDEFLDTAPFELDRLGIELLGPEQLLRAAISVRATATAAPSDDRRGTFTKEALVAWSAVVDDTPISDAELARAEAVGVNLLRAGHRWVRLDQEAIRKARRVLSEQLDHHPRVSPIELLNLAAGTAGDDPEVPLELDRVSTLEQLGIGAEASDDDDQWVAALLAGLPDDRLAEAHESERFHGELRHYQRRGLGWLQFLARVGLGGCLADDMGLGKTATTLAHLVERPGPHLVVCPLSVVHNWEAEARRFVPELGVMVHHGSTRHRSSTANGALFDTGIGGADLVITTYGLLPRDLDTLAGVVWNTVVLDEAQMVKNPVTKAAKAVRALGAEQKLALTGTPVENRLSELWAILDAVNPGLLGSRTSFRERFGTPIERHRDDEAAARLRTLTQPFVLRRTKADRTLLPELPDKIEQIAYAQLTAEQATLYRSVVDQLLVDADQLDGMKRRGRVLAALTRLKQICNHPAHALGDGGRLAGRSGKLNRFDELIGDLLDLDQRALVFTQFREMGELLRRHLTERWSLDVPFLHGGVTKARRDAMVANFQDPPRSREPVSPLLLVSLKAGGTGLNLTAAAQVIHYDRWWNPAVEDQATDRAWRLGQQQTVNVHKLVCQGTVEERIGEMIDEKRALADSVVGTGEAWLSELSTSALAELVTLDGGEQTTRGVR